MEVLCCVPRLPLCLQRRTHHTRAIRDLCRNVLVRGAQLPLCAIAYALEHFEYSSVLEVLNEVLLLIMEFFEVEPIPGKPVINMIRLINLIWTSLLFAAFALAEPAASVSDQ